MLRSLQWHPIKLKAKVLTLAYKKLHDFVLAPSLTPSSIPCLHSLCLSYNNFEFAMPSAGNPLSCNIHVTHLLLFSVFC